MNILLISMYSDKWNWKKQHKLYRKAIGKNAKLIIKRYYDKAGIRKVLDRFVLLKPPTAGIPGQKDLDDAALVARVPIYGLKDSGRQFWRNLEKLFCQLVAK